MTAHIHTLPDLEHAHATELRPRESRAHSATSTPQAPSNKALWTGRIVSGFALLFLAVDAGMKLVMAPQAVQGTTELGYPATVLFSLGLVQLACLALYLFPKTAILGAILWTGYLGGAVATHVRVGNPLFSHILFPVYVAVMLWAGLWLRDLRLRSLLPLR